MTNLYNNVIYQLMISCMGTNLDEKQEFHFGNAWFGFAAIGLIGFKFTEEQIEEAYFAKNAVNHARQDNGY